VYKAHAPSNIFAPGFEPPPDTLIASLADLPEPLCRHLQVLAVPAAKPLHASSQVMRLAEGWLVESIDPSRYEGRPDPNDISFSDGGPKAWFVLVRRSG